MKNRINKLKKEQENADKRYMTMRDETSKILQARAMRNDVKYIY